MQIKKVMVKYHILDWWMKVIIMAKSRVTPLKFVSFPRLELTAALLSIKVSLLLKKELRISIPIREFYWTDSKVVLGYLRN